MVIKKGSHLLLALFLIIFNSCWGMDTKKKPTVTQIINSLSMIEEKNALTDIRERLKIEIKDITTSSENKVIGLDLSGNTIKNLDSLIELLEKIPHLFFLNLNNCGIENVTPLKALPLLKRLYLSNNSIKNSTGLEGLKRLTVLDLSNNSVEIDFKGKREHYNKINSFAYSVKQKVVRPVKKEKPETKILPKKTNIPLTLSVVPPKKNHLNYPNKISPVVQNIEPLKEVGQKIRGEKRKNEDLEDIQKSKRFILNPSNQFIAPTDKNVSKRNAPSRLHTTPSTTNDVKEHKIVLIKQNAPTQANSSYMNLFNKYKNWVLGGLSIAAIGASTYLLNKLKKEKPID